jgi:hypothetical protein
VNPDPDLIRIQWSPGSISGSGSRRAIMTLKNRRKFIKLISGSAGCSLLRAEGFSSSLDVLYFMET